MVRIWADLQDSYYQARAHGDLPEMRLQIAAQCAACWWKWAREKEKWPPFQRLADHSMPQHGDNEVIHGMIQHQLVNFNKVLSEKSLGGLNCDLS
jgi:hypothetical protein